MLCGAEPGRCNISTIKSQSALQIRDFRCPSAEHCVAAGVLILRDAVQRRSGTDYDGGADWSLVDLREEPQALAFLDERTGWLATTGRLGNRGRWPQMGQACEAGGLEAIYFLDQNRGFAAGYPKAAYETADGGKTWTKIGAPAEWTRSKLARRFTTPLRSPATSTVYSRPQPEATSGGQPPAWLDPQRAQRRGGSASRPGFCSRPRTAVKPGSNLLRTGKSGFIQIVPGLRRRLWACSTSRSSPSRNGSPPTRLVHQRAA